ncbi:MAG TPA: FecR domain-containing protein [Bryobacteraceae bacterium]|nr:FecR domain-containing protein [Bryobacteraceae bacterium]
MNQDRRNKFNLQISEEAAEWFVDFRLGNIDAAGRQEFDAWIRRSPEHLCAYIETAAIWNEGSSLAAHRDLDSDALIALAHTEGNVVPLDLDRPWALRENKPNSHASEERAKPTRQASQVDVSTKHRTPRRRLVSAAAVLAMVVLGSTAMLLWQLGRETVYATAVGERRILKLEDGSSVELNSRSRIRVRFAQTQRDVELLEGQVLFHVAKDPHRPFIVHSDSVRVRAVGTQFDVKRKSAGTTVTVVEGRVAVYQEGAAGSAEPGATSPVTHAYSSLLSSRGERDGSAQREDKGKQGRAADKNDALAHPRSERTPAPEGALQPARSAPAIFLSAGEQLIVSDQAPPAQPQHTSPAAATAWTQGQLILDSASLADVADEFNRYSTRQLTVEDRGAQPLQLSGVFATDPDFLLRYLRQRPDITIQETRTEVHIIRRD